MLSGDPAAVLAVYQAGLDTEQASFETRAPDWDTFTAGKLPDHRHVAVDAQDRILGWVAASPVSARPVYAGVVEHSVYVHPAARGHGVGLALLRALIASTEAAGIWTIQSGIFPENTASLRLRHRAGFRVIGGRADGGAYNRQKFVVPAAAVGNGHRVRASVECHVYAWVDRDTYGNSSSWRRTTM